MFLFLNLYKAHPLIEYASTVWSVIYKKDCISLENVQRRATRMVHNISHLNYTERMKDMTEVFKILNGIDKCEKDKLFTLQPMVQEVTVKSSLNISLDWTCGNNFSHKEL